ncbi:MAG: DM13 domain-containing protein [Alphaproteobacteria bacterium]|nr:DM13 domain-containing protein [Alphaproteobacteria bacterium]
MVPALPNRPSVTRRTILTWLGLGLAMVTIDSASATTATGMDVAHGRFIHVDPSDTLHWGRGSVIVRREGNRQSVEFGDDFAVAAGPDLVVYLVERAEVRSAEDFLTGGALAIGPLKATTGRQRYEVPDDVPLEAVGSVVIWCRSVGVLFSPARLAHRSARTGG